MLRNELATMFRRRRTQAILLALAALPIAISLAVRFAGGPDAGEGPTFLSQITHNGVFAVLAGLSVALPFFLPMSVAVVAGDALAGRTRLLAVKGLAAAVFCLAGTLTVAVAGLAAGVVLFPIRDVTTLSGDTLPLATGMLRIGGAAVIVALSLIGLAAVGLFISTLTDVPVGAMAGTLAFFVFVGVVDALPQTRALHPWLLTDHWLSFTDLLRTQIRWGGIGRNLGLQGLYLAVFGTAAWARLTTKDITS